jgi:hypothetical protein
MENQSAEITIDYKAHFNKTGGNYDLTIRNLDLDKNNSFAMQNILLEEDDNDYTFFSYIDDLDARDQVFKTIVSGDATRYPFDNYSLNLGFEFPIIDEDEDNKTRIDATPIYYSTGFNPSLKDNWITTSNIYLVPSSKGHIPVSKEPFESLNFSKNPDNIKFNFYRNYSIAIIVIPLFSIFFLLGAIFIFENSSDNIGNRLALTLGIFALLFTLREIIDSMKPETSAPTIADSMLSIIIISTIAFTISSIISSSSTIQRWFPKHHSWIDGIVFVIVARFVITYFNKYLLDSQLWWLVPLIIFGLGYGLLLRTLGIKVNKPLIRFSRVSKEKDI